MYRSPYETTTLSNYDVVKIKNEIEQEIVRGDLVFEPLMEDIPYATSNLLTIDNSEKTGHIPLFSQPLLVNTHPATNDPANNKMVVDCRGYTTTSREGIVTVKKPAQYKNQLIAGALSTYWYFDGHVSLFNVSKFPTKVFANWITSTLTNKLNLDELSQVRTSAIVAYYFICQFNDYPEYSEKHLLSEDELYTIGIKVGYATGLKVHDAIEMIRNIPTMNNINDLSTALKTHGGSDRYRQINTALIYMLLGRFGMNGMTPETVVAAVEYPPLFLAIVYIAATERGYNKSSIGNIVHNLRNMNDVKTFVTEIRDILQGS